MSPTTDEAALDNPAYAALGGPHARFAQVRGRARRYPDDVAPFLALPSPLSAQDWRDAAELVPPGTLVAGRYGDAELGDGWRAVDTFDLVQMIGERVTGAECAEAISLGAAGVPEMLESEEAARRLGVKVSTLYAYVSRGLLVSQPDPVRRGSLFDLDQVEALATRSRGGRQTATRMATITTGVTQLNQELGPIYRGHLATELARESPFEDVAELLWQSEGGGDWRARSGRLCGDQGRKGSGAIRIARDRPRFFRARHCQLRHRGWRP